MNFQNNQQRKNFSQSKWRICFSKSLGKGDIQPKPKQRININPSNSFATEKVAADKEKKVKSNKSKITNQWITEEEDDHNPTPVKSLESNSFFKSQKILTV